MSKTKNINPDTVSDTDDPSIQASQYSLSFDLQGGTGSFPTIYGDYASKVQIHSGSPTKSGYSFRGWATKAGGTPSYQPGSYYTLFWSVTLYASWSEGEAEKTFNLVYANYDTSVTNMPTGGTQNCSSFTISSQIPIKSGYEFKGWSTSYNSSYVEYYAGSTYSRSTTDQLTLYPVFEKKQTNPETYRITYDGNGNNVTNVPGSTSYYWYEGGGFTVSSIKPVRTGYTFLGWSKTSNGTVDYNSGEWCSEQITMTLYAVWQEEQKETYTITYSSNTTDQVENMPTSQTKTEGINLTLSPNIPTREGYIFVCWNENSNNSGTSYQHGDTFLKDASTILYAIWNKDASNGEVLDLFWTDGGIDSSGQVTTNSSYSHSRYIKALELNGATVETDFQLGVYLYDASTRVWESRLPNISAGQVVLPENYVEENYVVRLEVSTAKKNTVVITSSTGKPVHTNMYIGSDLISSVYMGGQEVTAMYLGNIKIW